jgi:endonuclease/exonuclease/phosphatase family metal-dependent hydrolase
MKKPLKILLCVLGGVVLLALLFVGYLTLTEYRPAEVEAVEVQRRGEAQPLSAARAAEGLTILSWNVGYGDLDASSDFFMDGGVNVRNHQDGTAAWNCLEMEDLIQSLAPDFCLLQEVDVDSARSRGVDERQALSIAGADHTFALNYSTHFVPYPLPPLGRVHGGLLTMSGYIIDRAERVSLPCPFSWPIRTVNLKRCLLVNYLPLEGSDKELVIIDLHLEAYDSGEGKIAQTKQLMDFLRQEYEKGNYVIAGGDFNQVFPGALEAYPNTHPENWIPGVLEESSLPEGFSFVYDLSVPSCRLLNQPYDPSDTANTQHYVIDGLIVSPNVTVEAAETLDLGFANSDHNPVRLAFTLG